MHAQLTCSLCLYCFLYYTKIFHFCLFCHEKVYIYFSALAILTYDNFV